MDETIYHFLPSLSIGGAESLVLNSVVNINKKNRYFLVFFEAGDSDLWEKLSEEQKKYIIRINGVFKIGRYINCLLFLYKKRSSVIISSLWKSALIMYVFSIFFKLKKHIAFVHRSTTAHFIDKFFRVWQVNHSLLQIADSAATKNWVINNCKQPNVYEVPLLFDVDHEFRLKNINFIKFCFVGRLSKVKNIERVLDLMLGLFERLPNSVFDIYGSDQGELQTVHKFGRRNKLDNIINYKGVLMPWEVKKKIAEYHFIISLSHTEGMAMSIAEAMQLGVVPIVGNVGGPSTYCRHMENAFITYDYSDLSLANIASIVSEVSGNELKYNQMSRSAYETFKTWDNYETSFLRILEKA